MKLIHKAKTVATSQKEASSAPHSVYDIPLTSLEGTPIDLGAYKGKMLLFVNVASKCGFTKQYKELQTLSEQYKDELVVIGVPCNQFGHQEPGDADSIRNFCSLTYEVTFPITEKAHVKGSQQHPLYRWLTQKAYNGKKNSSVRWNFQKYLVDNNGQLIDYYYSMTSPLSNKIKKNIQ